MVTSSGQEVAGRALRARRSSQRRRQCARCALVDTSRYGRLASCACETEPVVSRTVCVRSKRSHRRRIWQRSQSPQSTGQTGGGATGCGGTAATTGALEERGQNTALTRRGLVVLLL